MHPLSTGGVGHDSFNIGNAIGFCQLRRLLCSPDILAVREVTDHRFANPRLRLSDSAE